MTAQISAGLLMYRLHHDEMEVLLGHPGGPYYQNKQDCWGILKGLVEPGEDIFQAARREFEEETGLKPHEPFLSLGQVVQKNNKVVHVWAFRGDLPEGYVPISNLCDVEWPPRSGHIIRIPEIDEIRFFTLAAARECMKETQQPFLERLLQVV